MSGLWSNSKRKLEEIKDTFFRKCDKNVLFYKGEIRAQPDGLFVDEIHKEWYNDFERLEFGHNYIQWLFPILETGQNSQAQALAQHEAEEIRKDPKAMERFLLSYEMMLNFYGIKLVDRGDGTVDRADNWEEQFKNLNFSEHNFLRITRILKSLGELGLEHYKAPLLRFLLTEAIERRTLQNTLDSCHKYWIPTLKDQAERERLVEHSRKSVEARRQAESGLASRNAAGPATAVSDEEQTATATQDQRTAADSTQSAPQRGQDTETDVGASSAGDQHTDEEKSRWASVNRAEDAVSRIQTTAPGGLSTTPVSVAQSCGKTVKREQAFNNTETSVDDTPQLVDMSSTAVRQSFSSSTAVSQSLSSSTAVSQSPSGDQPSLSCSETQTTQIASSCDLDDNDNPFKIQPYE